jgi:hypothetical protein
MRHCKEFTTRMRLLAAGFLFGVFVTNPANALQRISSRPSCGKCSITAHRVTTIGKLNDEGSVARTSIIARDSRGQIYIAPGTTPGEIHVYSSEGKFVRTIGRPGKGPGEFTMARAIAFTPEDSLIVYDMAGLTVSVLDPQGRFVRAVKLPLLIGAENGVWYGHGQLLMNGELRTRDRPALAMHRIPFRGTGGFHSFMNIGQFRADQAYNTTRFLAAVPQGWWVLHANRYELEMWDTAFVKRSVLTRDADWFEPWLQWPNPLVKLPLSPISIDMDADARGWLWVVIEVPGKNQKAQLRRINGREGSAWEWKSHEKAFDTMLEVIDPKNATLVTSARLDPRFVASLGNGYFASYREDRSGNPLLDIWRLQVRGFEN